MTQKLETETTMRFDGFRKRSGVVTPFRKEKIEQAVLRATEAVARNTDLPANKDVARKIADGVVDQLDRPGSEYYVGPDAEGLRIPRIEDVQDLVEILLAESGETMTLASFKRYRKKRELARARSCGCWWSRRRRILRCRGIIAALSSSCSRRPG